MVKNIFLAIALCCYAVTSFADSVLNDAYVLKTMNAFEQAYAKKDTAFFNKHLAEEATFTIHTREFDKKHALQYTRQDILDGELFQHAQILDQLERQPPDIEYYNDNTQALLKYTLSLKEGSKFQSEKGYSVETQMLFQLKKGAPKIVSIISHINTAPRLEQRFNQQAN